MRLLITYKTTSILIIVRANTYVNYRFALTHLLSWIRMKVTHSLFYKEVVMDTDTVQQEFEDIGFEIVEVDERDVLLYELSDGSEEEDGQYAIVSDEDGRIPVSMDTPVIVSVYDDNDAFQWSVTLPNGEELKELFLRVESAEELLDTLQDIRHENIERYDSEMDSYAE